MTTPGGKDLGQELRRRSGPGLALLVWIYLYITVLLAAWLLVTSMATGWSPTVVTSGSMSPGLRIGDVILLDTPSGERLAQHTIVTFDHEGERVAHRIFSVEADGYVTKGDANATPDTNSIAFSEVTGVGRFVVPLVGLPVVWLATGNTIAFAAWVFSIIGSLALVGSRRRSKTKMPVRALSTTPLRAIRSVRVVVGFLILTQFIVDPNRLDIGVGAVGRGGIVVTSLLVLAVTNLASITLSKTSDERQLSQLAIGELAIDTFLVVALTTATGTEGIGWVLFALPIIESATRFRISGALLHWMMLTAFSLVTRIVALDQQGVTSQELFADLEKQVDQLSVLLLVVIPGAYLAEQLLNDVWTQRSATDDALHQSQLLQRVVDTTNSVSRLGADVLTELTTAVVELGFSSSDIVAFNGSRWETLASNGLRLPAAGEPASTLRTGDIALTGAIADREDESEEEREALRAIGLQAVVRFDVQNDDDDTRLCIRAGLRATGQPAVRSIEALRLLASHASVALQNETLLGEMRFMHDRMQHQAQSDPLTRLPNRTRFLSELRSALEESPVAVMFCDLNGFKPVNDRMGHDAGDELLIAVAGRLARLTNAPNVAARFGGDEFTILLPLDPSEADAEILAREIVSAVAQPFAIGRGAARISTSVGIGFGQPGDHPDEVLRRADVAMYHAKAGSAPHIAHYIPDMDVKDQRRNRLALEFREAMRNDQITMVYQPIVASIDGTDMFGSEALIRWHHPDLGHIPPPDIIDLASQLGLTDELNRFVLDQTLRVARECNDAHPDRPPTVITANLSPGELELPSLVENVQAALAKHEIPAEQLILELSENLITPDEEKSGYVDRLDRLTKIGVRLLIDDFGEGRTSLGFLRSLPIAGVKIDRSLVVNSTDSAADEAIVASIIGLAHDLDLFIVAEGIETVEQGQLLKTMGADQLQGYLLHRPMPGQDFIDLHAQQPLGHSMIAGRNEYR